MVSSKIVISNPTGLHLRPAGILCKEAGKYESLITFQSEQHRQMGERSETSLQTGNLKSVLSVLGACIKCGDEIEVTCEGKDEEDALKNLLQLIQEGLGE